MIANTLVVFLFTVVLAAWIKFSFLSDENEFQKTKSITSGFCCFIVIRGGAVFIKWILKELDRGVTFLTKIK